ncbi:MAG: Acyl-CoA dehydrogenase FadE27 [Acidimicrobiales bacterium]|nr:Acyl-CoA dehydrogenase FadE27 [Acidimicrobiales bacterium]
MDFELSEDQEALRGAARELLEGKASSRQVRRVVEAGGGWDRGLWEAMVEQGWTGIAVPEDVGGVGLGTVEVAVLLEQVGARVAPVPILSQVVALDALTRARAAGVARLDDWIDGLLDGSSLGCVAFRPVDVDGEALRGRPEPVPFAPSADVCVTIAAGADGPGLFAIDLSGIRPPAEPAMDRTRELGWLVFDGTPGVRLGGAEAVEAFIDLGSTAYAAEMLGAAAEMLDASVEYAGERVQFDRPIGSFQAVKHRCADMLVDVEGMRSAVYYASWAISASDADASIAASTAKIWCSDASKRVMASALQVHGGIGFTWESDVHLYLKRSQLDEVSFGDASWHRSRLARLLRPRIEAGESVI